MQHLAQAFLGGLAGLVNQGHLSALEVEVPQQGPGQQGLAVAGCPGQKGGPAPLPERVEQAGYM